MGLAGLALAIAVGASVLAPRPSAGPAPELAGLVNVEVALIDGTTLEDPDGLLLPEGAVVTVGQGGSARVGDTVLGPGDTATMRDGRLQVEHQSPVAVLPQPTPTRSRPPEETGRPASQPPASQPPQRSPSPTPGGAATASPPSAATSTPSPSPTARPARTDPSPAATSTSKPAIHRPVLRARLISGPRVAVRWTATRGAHSYLLLATWSTSGPAPKPTYPAAPGTRIVGEFASPPAQALRMRVPDGVVEVRLRVVALRPDGTVLRQSRVVTVTIAPNASLSSDPDVSPSPSPTPTPTPAP